MTIDQIIALVASVGACLSAIAAFLVIHQVSKQSENSYRPKLAVSRTKFQCISDPLAKGNIPGTWHNWTDEEEAQNVLFFTVPLHNVGLGAAKDLNLKWSFQIEETVSKVNELAKKSLTPIFFEYKNEMVTLKTNDMCKITSMWGNQNESYIDFVLPASVAKSPIDLVIPPAFILIVSALVHFYSKTDGLGSLKEIPSLIVAIDYFDIGGKKHKTKISITTKTVAIIGEGESFLGYLEAININV